MFGMKKAVALSAAVILIMMCVCPALGESGTFCPSCGQYIQPGANFCSNCGSAVNSSAGSVRAVLTEKRISTRTGPGTGYDEPGSFLSKGDTVTVLSKVWDGANGIYWVQVEFTAGRHLYRAYTGSWRFDGLDVGRVRDESVIGTCVTPGYSQTGYYGPGYQYREIKAQVPADTSCSICALENDFLQLEFYDSAQGCMRRAWVLEPFVDNYTLWNDQAYNY